MNTHLCLSVYRVLSQAAARAAAITLLLGHFLLVGQAHAAITANELFKLTAADHVDRSDVALLSTSFGITSGATEGQGDFDGDGAVTLRDLLILKTNLDSSPIAVTSNAAVVPEPNTLVIWLLLGALGMTAGWRRRQRA